MANIGIVGYGIVGKAVEHGFDVPGNNIKWYDKFKPSDSLKDVVNDSEFIFLCLPTPTSETKNRIDLSILDENIAQIAQLVVNHERRHDKVIVVKSSVVPGTTRKYAKQYPECRFCFNPEFLTEANYKKDFVTADRHVIGADNDHIRLKVIDLYRARFKETRIFATDLTTAEMIKYMANADLSTQVIISNEFYELCQKLGVVYDVVRQAVEVDPRIGKHHMAPGPDGDFGFGGKCLPKDLKAIIGCFQDYGVDASVLKAVFEKNLKVRRIRDWEDIPGVKSD